jgi:spermidine/putrescine transport system substrate-binding protein
MQVRLLFILFWVMILLGFILLSHVSQHVSQTRSLSVYMWADKIDESILQKFEQETGIKVYVNYYESNEELVTKFEIAKDLNCDVILPSEYIIETLAKAGFLKKLDKSRCDFIDRISLEFMGKYFDSRYRDCCWYAEFVFLFHGSTWANNFDSWSYVTRSWFYYSYFEVSS